MFCVENKLNYSFRGSIVVEGWKENHLQSHERHTKTTRKTQSTLQAAQVFVRLWHWYACAIRWKTGRLLTEARSMLPYLNLCCLSVGSSHMLIPSCLSTFCSQGWKQAAVLMLRWSPFPIWIMLLFIRTQPRLELWQQFWIFLHYFRQLRNKIQVQFLIRIKD